MTVQAPLPDYAAARSTMVDSQLRAQGVNDPAVVAAMARVPREEFVPNEVRPLAYIDRTLPIGGGRLMSPPAVPGLLLTQLAPVRGERALVVGAGTGYSAAVLREIGLEVTAVESSPELAATARERGIAVTEGPLEAGARRGAPYDIVLIDGAVEFIPDTLITQLKDGGRLGAALVEGGISRLIVGRKAGGGFGYHSFSDTAAAALPGFRRPRGFTF